VATGPASKSIRPGRRRSCPRGERARRRSREGLADPAGPRLLYGKMGE
jgi:hypothetical protein